MTGPRARARRVGIVGLGTIAAYYLDALERVPGWELAAVCDPRPDALRPYGNRVAAFRDHRDMLAESSLDSVVVAAPNDAHAPICRDALDAGEERACAALERAADSVGRALAAACTTANPERIVLGGEVAALGPVFLDAVHASFRHYAPTRVHRHVSVTPAALDDRGGALGALALALHESPLLAGYSSWLPGHVDESTTADPDGSDADDQFARAAAHPGSARDAD